MYYSSIALFKEEIMAISSNIPTADELRAYVCGELLSTCDKLSINTLRLMDQLNWGNQPMLKQFSCTSVRQSFVVHQDKRNLRYIELFCAPPTRLLFVRQYNKSEYVDYSRIILDNQGRIYFVPKTSTDNLSAPVKGMRFEDMFRQELHPATATGMAVIAGFKGIEYCQHCTERPIRSDRMCPGLIGHLEHLNEQLNHEIRSLS